jgi:hypothetical protein
MYTCLLFFNSVITQHTSALIFHVGLHKSNKTTVLYEAERKHMNFHQNASLYIKRLVRDKNIDHIKT